MYPADLCRTAPRERSEVEQASDFLRGPPGRQGPAGLPGESIADVASIMAALKAGNLDLPSVKRIGAPPGDCVTIDGELCLTTPVCIGVLGTAMTNQAVFKLDPTVTELFVDGHLSARGLTNLGPAVSTSRGDLKQDKRMLRSEQCIDWVRQFKPISYRWVAEEGKPPPPLEVGLNAFDVARTCPMLAAMEPGPDGEPEPAGVNYDRLSVLLIVVVQTLLRRTQHLATEQTEAEPAPYATQFRQLHGHDEPAERMTLTQYLARRRSLARRQASATKATASRNASQAAPTVRDAEEAPPAAAATATATPSPRDDVEEQRHHAPPEPPVGPPSSPSPVRVVKAATVPAGASVRPVVGEKRRRWDADLSLNTCLMWLCLLFLMYCQWSR